MVLVQRKLKKSRCLIDEKWKHRKRKLSKLIFLLSNFSPFNKMAWSKRSLVPFSFLDRCDSKKEKQKSRARGAAAGRATHLV